MEDPPVRVCRWPGHTQSMCVSCVRSRRILYGIDLNLFGNRYVRDGVRSDLQIWTEAEPREWSTQGSRLRFDLSYKALVSWQSGNQDGVEQPTTDSGVGVQTATLDLRSLAAGAKVLVVIKASDSRKQERQKLVVR